MTYLPASRHTSRSEVNISRLAGAQSLGVQRATAASSTQVDVPIKDGDGAAA